MATVQQVVECVTAHPRWTVRDIALELNCTTAYVRATAYRQGIKIRGLRIVNKDRTRILRLGYICHQNGLSEADLMTAIELKKHVNRKNRGEKLQ